MYLIIRNIHLYSKNKQFSKICTNDKCLEDSCAKNTYTRWHMIYTDVWPFGLLLAHRLILVAQANLRVKKACINSQCFDFYLKRDVHVRLQRFTEKKLFSLLKKGNSWNKALCIIILSLIYSDTAFKMHGVKSVYWLKEHQGYQNDSIPRALYFRSFSSKYSWKKYI